MYSLQLYAPKLGVSLAEYAFIWIDNANVFSCFKFETRWYASAGKRRKLCNELCSALLGRGSDTRTDGAKVLPADSWVRLAQEGHSSDDSSDHRDEDRFHRRCSTGSRSA